MKTRWRALAAAVLLVAGCTAPEDQQPELTVIGPWTGAEERHFQLVIDAFKDKYHVDVNYQGSRNVEQVLQAEMRKGTPPEIAIMPSPGSLQRYIDSGLLHPFLDLPEGEDYAPQWRNVLKLGNQQRFAVPVKASLKSLVWYRSNGQELEPRTWEEMLALADRDGLPWCMGMGSPPVSGWPGTDWVEDILLQQTDTDTYLDWARGELSWNDERVRRAWLTWGEIVGDAERTEGVPSVLLTNFGDAGRGMLSDTPTCSMDHAGSFVPAYHDPAGVPVDYFRFPPFAAKPVPQPQIVSVDLAVMVKPTPQQLQPPAAALDFMGFLATDRDGQRIMRESSPTAFSVNQGTAGRWPARQTKEIERQLADPGSLCVDASDLMPAAMRDAFTNAVMEFVSDPSRLNAILNGLDKVRNDLRDTQETWTRFACF